MVDFRTPKGREFREIDGNAPLIDERGTNIVRLARKMESTVRFIDQIAEPGCRTEAGEGEAMDSIRDEGKDLRDELELAAERYRPTGEAMVEYAEYLEKTQPEIDDAIDAAERSYQAYLDALEALQTAQSAEANFDMPDDPSPADNAREQGLKDATSTAQGNVATAQSTFEQDGQTYDRIFERWEVDEYDATVRKITEAIDGGLNDGFWDNVMGALEAIVEVLKWVGLVLAVLALVFGGPLLALAALVVGVLILVGTIVLAMDGRKGLGDIIWAVVGILPLGKLAKGPAAFFKETFKQFKTPVTQIRQISGLKNLMGHSSRGPWSGAVANNFNAFKSKFGPYMFSSGKPSWGGVFQRFTGGGSHHYNSAVTNLANSSGPKFNAFIQSPQGIGNLFTPNLPNFGERVISTGMNIFNWSDRAVSLPNGNPSGGLKGPISGAVGL